MLVALIVLHSLLIYLLTSSNTSSDTSSTILPTHIFVLINHLQLSTPQPTVLSAAAHHLMISLLTAVYQSNSTCPTTILFLLLHTTYPIRLRLFNRQVSQLSSRIKVILHRILPHRIFNVTYVVRNNLNLSLVLVYTCFVKSPPISPSLLPHPPSIHIHLPSIAHPRLPTLPTLSAASDDITPSFILTRQPPLEHPSQLDLYFPIPLLPIPYFLNTPADQLKSASTAHSITMTEFYDSATHTTLSTFSSLCYPTPTLTYLLPTFLPYTYLLIFLQRYQPCYPRCYHQSVQLSCKLFAASVQPSN